MNDKETEGYFSVEAALVLPVVLGVYLFMIVLLFIQHDRCLMEQDMASMLIKAVNYRGTPKQQLEYMQGLATQWDREQYVWIQQAPPYCSIRGQRICLEAAGTYTMPINVFPTAIEGTHQIEVGYQIIAWDRTMLAQILSKAANRDRSDTGREAGVEDE
ncbi:MAG: hypothetical protein NC543_12980 [bacterium]|nr:hypothetical protein [bacterium]MCM1374692.1 hypothetical protein [Muribaculum sp.]